MSKQTALPLSLHQTLMLLVTLVLILAGVLFGVVKTCRSIYQFFSTDELSIAVEQVGFEGEDGAVIALSGYVEMPEIDEQLLTINEYSRSGELLESVDNIVIHYVGNPGTTGQENRNYFEMLATTGETSVSSNFVIGLVGEIILCVPMDEVAYASTSAANYTSLSIECCHWDETGAFTEETYDSLVHLTAWLCQEYGLTGEDVIRHYDVTGKLCPLYYVNNEDEWLAFKEDVDNLLATGTQ